ncbi:immunity 22 family protein [Flavobacterium sp.]|uniref:immunity 22 family protein n=1 Tax=Flavobacterium sp. TaxID=239 RepID=UPI00374D1A50
MKTETCHFWFGKFESEKEYFDFVGEDPAFYEDEVSDEDQKYISEFAKSQNENFLDHDFIESGFENQDISFEDKFVGYSYSDKWILEAQNRLVDQNLQEINTIIFISKNQIETPVTITNSKFRLLYIGEIEYEI